jgi:hypothetical protein
MTAHEIQTYFYNYFRISKQIATVKRRHRLGVFCRMIACRLLFQHRPFFYGLYNLDDRRMADWAEYLTKEEMDRLEKQLNPAQYTDLVTNKLLFYERCLMHRIPTPPVLGVLPVKALKIPAGIPAIKTEEQLRELLLEQNNTRLLLKTVDGSYGAGLLSILVQNGQIFDHHGTPLTVHDVFKYCHDYQRNFLIQPHLTPHPDVTSLMPGLALGTFRLVTLLQRQSQTVTIPYAFVRVPLRVNIIDNFVHGETGNMVCQIDVEHGTLMEGWGKPQVEPGMHRIERHPDTQVVFRGFRVPYWQEILSLVRRATTIFPEFLTLGWDIAITDQGLSILEANWHYDPDLPQIVLNRGVKSELKALYRNLLV